MIFWSTMIFSERYSPQSFFLDGLIYGLPPKLMEARNVPRQLGVCSSSWTTAVLTTRWWFRPLPCCPPWLCVSWAQISTKVVVKFPPMVAQFQLQFRIHFPCIFGAEASCQEWQMSPFGSDATAPRWFQLAWGGLMAGDLELEFGGNLGMWFWIFVFVHGFMVRCFLFG